MKNIQSQPSQPTNLTYCNFPYQVLHCHLYAVDCTYFSVFVFLLYLHIVTSCQTLLTVICCLPVNYLCLLKWNTQRLDIVYHWLHPAFISKASSSSINYLLTSSHYIVRFAVIRDWKTVCCQPSFGLFEQQILIWCGKHFIYKILVSCLY